MDCKKCRYVKGSYHCMDCDSYDGNHEEIKELNGIDFYAIDEILEKEENPNSTM